MHSSADVTVCNVSAPIAFLTTHKHFSIELQCCSLVQILHLVHELVVSLSGRTSCMLANLAAAQNHMTVVIATVHHFVMSFVQAAPVQQSLGPSWNLSLAPLAKSRPKRCHSMFFAGTSERSLLLLQLETHKKHPECVAVSQ